MIESNYGKFISERGLDPTLLRALNRGVEPRMFEDEKTDSRGWFSRDCCELRYLQECEEGDLNPTVVAQTLRILAPEPSRTAMKRQ